MRGIALSLGAVCSLGVMALGSRAVGGDRPVHALRTNPVDSAAVQPAASADDRVWYGGTLAPIVVVAQRPETPKTRLARDCPSGGG
jgi:hypothetical protein